MVECEGDPLVHKTKKAEQEAIDKGVAISLLTRQVQLTYGFALIITGCSNMPRLYLW